MSEKTNDCEKVNEKSIECEKVDEKMWEKWSTFKNYLIESNDNEIKGKYFEIFSYYLLKLHPNYNYDLDKIWLYADFPKKKKEKLGLPLTDKGTDIVFSKKNEYIEFILIIETYEPLNKWCQTKMCNRGKKSI